MTKRQFAAPFAPQAGPRLRTGFARDKSTVRTKARCEAVRVANVNELFIYGALTPWPFFEDEISAADVIAALAQFRGEAVTVRINSPGGVVTEGAAIYNALRAHDGEITTQVDGLAASAAADVLMAGEKRVALGAAAFIMIHNAWGYCIGDSRDMLSYGALLEKMDGTQRKIMAERTGLPDEDLKAMLDAETWLTADEGVEKGFLTGVLGAENKQALAVARKFDLSGFDHAPSALIAPPESDADASCDDELADLERRLRHAMGVH